MITRRNFTLGLTAGAATLATSTSALGALKKTGQSATQRAFIFDAMGEIRDVYTDSLIAEIIDSGLNAIAVTLCDPKTFEQEAFDVTLAGIREYDRIIKDNSNFYLKATSVSDIERARAQNKIAIFYLTQNSTHIGRDLDKIDLFYSLGQRVCQITYNYQNWAGSGCKEKNGSGLTKFGHELVEKLNDTNMLIDLSHANMRTMADVAKTSKQPVHISHTCAMALFENERNTTDENMRAVADTGGVVGICQMRPFMTHEKKDVLHVYFEHIEHAIKVAGVDHVGIGSDRDHRRLNMTPEYIAELKREEGANFNDKEWPLYFEELNGPRRMEVIWDGMKKRGHSNTTLEKVFGDNMLRLYRDVVG